jgi:tripartite-type tricarboxylate transporter receptor subunit TctC
LVAPARTPEPVVQRLNDVLLKALARNDVKEKFGTIGADVAPMNPVQFGRFIQAEVAHWAKLVKLAGIQPE